jgi:hypothetical protein
MTSPSEQLILPFNPECGSEGDPLGRWKERYPDTTLDELRELDAELFGDVLSWAAPREQPDDDD